MGWQSSGGCDSIVRNYREIKEHATSGLTTGRRDLWIFAGMVGEALHEAELERLPKCDNNERWGFMRAKRDV
jgi:hypothetical protein